MPIEALEGITDQELFDQANADEAPADEPVAETQAEPEQSEQPSEQTQARDEQGRFAAEKPAEVAQPVQEEQPRNERIPLAEYLSEREKRQTFENELKAERERIAQERQEFQRRLQALEKPPAQPEKVERPDPLLDPEGYAKAIREEVRQEAIAERREESLQRAHKVYKTEFEEAYAAAQKQVDPALRARMQQSRDPGETLIEWHREQKTRAEVGNDLAAFREREQGACFPIPPSSRRPSRRPAVLLNPQPSLALERPRPPRYRHP
ncbi:hypothetical protein IVB34_12730 [Bradyrhizobium sp. 2]|uniref:hypothetical protein n=1 Tax=Bradyrhizobium sp. 2 TaxID=190045 RepID=UPI001FF995FE|nr:hypothetical protein [Bradyrhizobium sp. 2]MCK1459220.1 hypothetical protein [Bradyrhizobium sp. 2]